MKHLIISCLGPTQLKPHQTTSLSYPFHLHLLDIRPLSATSRTELSRRPVDLKTVNLQRRKIRPQETPTAQDRTSKNPKFISLRPFEMFYLVL
ncbi:hypothetical protein CASFOL_000887 [Castilleja foliolosa]|uniref:Uncharacterized protein n=1 Tax=Castilleja foliolosa TaxID=1961234 RepID=A0ABD3ELI5_9LAMI